LAQACRTLHAKWETSHSQRRLGEHKCMTGLSSNVQTGRTVAQTKETGSFRFFSSKHRSDLKLGYRLEVPPPLLFSILLSLSQQRGQFCLCQFTVASWSAKVAANKAPAEQLRGADHSLGCSHKFARAKPRNGSSNHSRPSKEQLASATYTFCWSGVGGA
jgi:hypothetical protein